MKVVLIGLLLLLSVMNIAFCHFKITNINKRKNVMNITFYKRLGFIEPKLKDKGRTGQMTIGLDQSSYWFFKSQQKDSKSLIICLGISPGISTLIDMSNGLGPFRSKTKNKASSLGQWWVNNPHSLNKKANLVFLDMMHKGGYSRFSTTKGLPIEAQNDIYFKHIMKLLDTELAFDKLEIKDIYLHGVGFATKFLPGLTNKLLSKGKAVKGLSVSSPMFSAYNNLKGSYVFSANNQLLSRSSLEEQQKYIEFLPVITKAKGDGAKSSIQKLLSSMPMYASKAYTPVNFLNIMETCLTYHKVCLKGEYVRTVYMNNPKFQMVSGITKTKLEVIDLGFSEDPYNNNLFEVDVTNDYVKLLEMGVKVLVTTGEYDLLSSWQGNL